MQITGACFCGEIAYEATVDTSAVGICHCRDCQIFSGSAFRLSCFARPDAFHLTLGTPREYTKTADSGNQRGMAFCGNCGTHLYSAPVDLGADDAFISIRLANSDQFAQLTPRYELYCDSKVAWIGAIEGTASFSRMPE